MEVYVNGDLEEKWEKLGTRTKDCNKGIRTNGRKDFNARTEAMGKWWEEERQGEEGKKSMDGK